MDEVWINLRQYTARNNKKIIFSSYELKFQVEYSDIIKKFCFVAWTQVKSKVK